jgi:hypothetical protein
MTEEEKKDFMESVHQQIYAHFKDVPKTLRLNSESKAQIDSLEKRIGSIAESVTDINGGLEKRLQLIEGHTLLSVQRWMQEVEKKILLIEESILNVEGYCDRLQTSFAEHLEKMPITSKQWMEQRLMALEDITKRILDKMEDKESD